MASEFSAESCGGTVVFVRSLYIYLHSLCIYVRMCVCVYVIYIIYTILQQMKVHCLTGWLFIGYEPSSRHRKTLAVSISLLEAPALCKDQGCHPSCTGHASVPRAMKTLRADGPAGWNGVAREVCCAFSQG